MPHIHKVTTADWPLWRQIRLTALAESPQAFFSRLADWESVGEPRWRARLALPGAYNVLAMLDEQRRPVGIASGIPDADGTPELHSVWVDPLTRGHGIGDLLITAIVDWARGTGAGALLLEVMADNPNATALYQRHGFLETGTAEKTGGGRTVRVRRMRKPLR